MAWRFHAIDATSSPWTRRLDGVEAHEGPRNISQDTLTHWLIFAQVAWTSEVTDPRIEFVEDASTADAVFAHSGGGKYQVQQHQLVSWFAYEAALIKKDHLAATLRRAGLAHLAPVTFDLETELDALLGFLAATDVCAGAETRLGLRVGGG